MSAGGRWKKQWNWIENWTAVENSFNLQGWVIRGCPEWALACLEKALSQLSSSLQRAIDIFFFFFNSFASRNRRHSCQGRKLRCVTFVLSFFPREYRSDCITLHMNNNRSLYKQKSRIQWYIVKRGSREERELNEVQKLLMWEFLCRQLKWIPTQIFQWTRTWSISAFLL